MRVLISGAGIAGPTIAYFLSEAGAQVTVVEKNQSILPHGQSIDIEGSAVAVIKKMGLLDQIRQFNTTEKGSQFIDPNGKPFAPFPVKEGSSGSLTSEYEILRGDLAVILYEATKDHPRVSYLFDTIVQKVIQNDEETVKIQLSDGEVQEFDVLIIADGQWSKLRKQCFSPELISVVDKDMYTAYWTIPRLTSDNDWWNIYLALGSRIIALRPDPHGTMRALITRMPCNEAQRRRWQEAARSNRKTQQELLRLDFADAGWQVKRFLDAMPQASDFYFHAVQQIKLAKWSRARIICLGDAAYAPSPLTGMGTSLAITGAYVLAGELSKLNDDEHPARAFDSYETIFRPFVEESQRIPPWIPAIAHPETAWKRWLLQGFISAISMLISLVIATPWLANSLNTKDKEDFPLPQYTVLEATTASTACNDNSAETVLQYHEL
jgi:2-polyprenyl-6-methoxyphenol hydroxylase-like FAD-dependent oxidoreductase